MNFLSPDDIFNGVRRKSLCNGALFTLTNKNGENSANTTPTKSKKERRRGSFNEPTTANNGRRSSLVSRWFKHISDAAEQYKPRSKNANHEPVDDPAIATLPHSNTRESLELTPERPAPQPATATVSTTPLAAMMPIATVSMTHAHAYSPHHMDGGNVQMRSSHRDGTPAPPEGLSAAAYHKQRLSHNELCSPGGGAGGSSVNRTMSTRSCDSNPHYANNESTLNGVTLRHTQSARQANAENGNAAGVPSKRDSASIVYSNNSNNTRTLMQSSPPLVEPTAIQISISPAHTAEPVLTPSERLRRLDASIREGLLEKQKIICDMFRLPVEHFHEIVDIAGMPEAPKDSADIALAAYAQVQSLTEVLNEYMHATPDQELLPAMSSSVCDQCHEKQQRHQAADTAGPAASTSSSACGSTAHQTPPPLPPPNKQSAQGQTLTQAQQQTPTTVVTKIQTHALDEADIHEDDDGYCEIDELRLPALLNLTTTKATPQPQMPTSGGAGGNFKAPLPPTNAQTNSAPTASPSPPELVKRQSTISAESIPEESADEVTAEAMDESPAPAVEAPPKDKETIAPSEQPEAPEESLQADATADEDKANAKDKENEVVDEDAMTANAKESTEKDPESEDTNEPEASAASPVSEASADSQAKVQDRAEVDGSKAPEAHENGSDNLVNEIIQNSMETLDALQQLTKTVSTVDNMTQTMPAALTLTTNTPWTNTNGSAHPAPQCGQTRIKHANTMEPSVPCHALNSIVSALNSQISLLLPKINERDMERERLRKENQHLRELLNAMHDRQRVEAKSETPTDIRSILSGAIELDDDIDGYSTNSTTPTPTPPATTDDTAINAKE